METPGEAKDGSLYPIAILIDEIKHDESSVRLNAIRKLQTIAQALGPERTRGELLPFLNEGVDDDDEVLLVLSEELGNLIPLVGGNEFAYTLLDQLEGLATVDESSVREKATESLRKVVGEMTPEHTTTYFVPLLNRLATRDWFTSRISACGLFDIGYNHLSPEGQKQTRDIFTKLCQDETPMVRRSAASALSRLVAKMSATDIEQEMLSLFQTFAEDKQDSVRLHTIENCIAFGSALSTEIVQTQIVPAVIAAATDRSWRVRWSVANKFPDFCKAIGQENCTGLLSSNFEKLLQDSEAEVRTSAAFKASAVAKYVDADLIVEKFVPLFQQLVVDSSDHVRSAFGSVIMGLAPILGRERTIQNILPLLLQLLRDTNSEVRLNVISNLEEGNKVIGIDLLSQSLLPAIIDLAEDRQWRVRLAIINYIPILATQVGMPFFDEKLAGLCIAWLGDAVYSIREAATVNLKRLTESFGSEWAKSNIIPKVFNMHADSNYLYRMTALNAVKVLCDVLPPETLRDTILPLVLELARDPVPNIRFNVAKTLQILIPCLEGPLIQEKIKPCLENLTQDCDNDVQYFANKAMLVC